MQIKILQECGYEWAKLGTSLSRNQPKEKMVSVCAKLAHAGEGHSKFLEFISVWIDILAPRYWWQQMATYRIGNSWLSQSTMYTITKRELTFIDFTGNVSQDILITINAFIQQYKKTDDPIIKDFWFNMIKCNLPEGFLQRRIMITNYKALRNIILQRSNHKLSEWKYFCSEVLKQIEHPEFIIQSQLEI